MFLTSLYICPWSLDDPLCQSQSLPYLFGLAKLGYSFALITFENPQFKLTKEQTKERRRQLQEANIYWYPVSYHQGSSLKAKALDNYNGIIKGLKIWKQHKPRIIHSRSSLPTAIAMALAKLTGMKFLYDADSVLSEEYVDIKHWSQDSSGFLVMAKSEKLARKRAKQIIVLTQTLRSDFINNLGVKTPIEVIPCCVDLNRFTFDAATRHKRRCELEITNEKLFTYVGKIGSWYLVEETFDFFKEVLNSLPNAKLLIITHDSPIAFKQIATRKGINDESYFIKKSSYSEVSEWLLASDVGLAFIKSLKSKRGSSPIKVAEYLAAGLPVVLTDKIGDCTELVNKNKVGAILSQTNQENYSNAIDQLASIWAEEVPLVSSRCRRVAEENFSLENIGIKRYFNIYQGLLSEK